MKKHKLKSYCNFVLFTAPKMKRRENYFFVLEMSLRLLIGTFIAHPSSARARKTIKFHACFHFSHFEAEAADFSTSF